MNQQWTIAPSTAHMKRVCKELGPDYRINIIDMARVIYRDLGHGYDVEIGGVNTDSLRKKACIYLWKDKNRIIKIVEKVPQSDIGAWVERLDAKVKDLTDEDFAADGYLIETRTESTS